MLSGAERLTCLEAFNVTMAPAVLIFTSALGGSGIDLICINYLVILQTFWGINKQK